MELIIAIFIVAGWYAYKYILEQKKNIAAPTPIIVEKMMAAEIKEKRNPMPSTSTCDFCDGEDIFIAGTKEKMPCPKCKRGMKIS